MILTITLIVLAYLFGSLSSAIIYCKLAGLPDPRTQSSGNPGATNVLRYGGKKAAAIVLAGDVLKGIIPVYIAFWLGVENAWLATIGLAAVLGHLYPVFFQFKGGKGVATVIGVLLALNWLVLIGFLAIWLLMAALFRYSSLAALTAMLSTPVIMYFTNPDYAWIVAIMALFIFIRHKDNIKRLLAGQEAKIGDKK